MEGENSGESTIPNNEGHKEHHTHHVVHKHAKKEGLTIKKQDLWMIATCILAVLLIISVTLNIVLYTNNSSGTGKTGTNTQGTKGNNDQTLGSNTSEVNKVKLDFYVMSKCPYGTQVEDAIKPALDKIGNSVAFSINFIANDNGDGTFTSLHGQTEVDGDIVNLCAMKYNPTKYMDMIVCMNANAGAIPGNWESCAKDKSLDVESIKACFEGQEGKDLLSTSTKKSKAIGASGSPTIYLNDKPYSGGRTENDFLRAICNAFTDAKPAACSAIPESKKVNVIALNDKRCKECDITGLVSSLKSIFPGLQVKEVDYSSAEGKTLLTQSGVKYLPAMLFDQTVEEGEGYAQVQKYLVPAGTDYTSLMIGASFDPVSEICDNKIDDTGDGKIDCEDADCTGALECREEKKNNLQVFIMADCPYGKKAVEALKGVKDNFGNATTYEIHYIASENADGTFTSLHGTYEADEDMTQLCALKHSPDKWFDFVYCRSIEGIKGTDWKDCAKTSGIDATKVQACFDGAEGKSLLREDIKIAEGLGIGASPTWLANNRYQFSGIDSETVKTEYCKYNTAQKGCEKTLSSDTGGVAAGGCAS